MEADEETRVWPAPGWYRGPHGDQFWDGSAWVIPSPTWPAPAPVDYARKTHELLSFALAILVIAAFALGAYFVYKKLNTDSERWANCVAAPTYSPSSVDCG